MLLPAHIAISGVVGSGKSTLGDALHRHLGYRVLAFADPLKRAVQEIFGMTDEDLWGPSEKRSNLYFDYPTTDYCFNCGGQCAGPERELSLDELNDDERVEEARTAARTRADYWKCNDCGGIYPGFVTPREALKTLGTEWGRAFSSHIWITRTLTKMPPKATFVITDCRFHNEREQVQARGGVTVLLLRRLEESTAPHASEREVRESRANFPYDLIIDNRDCSPEETYKKCIEGLQRVAREAVRPVFTLEVYRRDPERFA